MRSEEDARQVFPLLNDETFGVLRDDQGEVHDDFLFGRSRADVDAKSFLGNFARKRARRLSIALMILVFGIFGLRVGAWQILHGGYFRSLADSNRTRTRVNIPNRGVIYDRNGVLLAWNTPTFHLVASRNDLPKDPLERAIRFAEIAETLHVSDDEFETLYQKAKNDATILLATQVPYDAAMAYLALHGDDTQLTLELASERSYITDTIPTLSHVIGYTGPIAEEEYASYQQEGYRRFDDVGRQGIEAYDETQLRGTPGVEVVEVNAQGEGIRMLQKTDVVEGENLSLSLDASLTSYIEQALASRLHGATTHRAAVVVSSAKNGEILSLVSYPAFDANLFARGIDEATYQGLLADEDAPLFPRATQGEYPSGSTIKPVYAAAALTEGIITPSTSFLSTGGLWLGTRFFPDWRPGGHGVTNVYHAIADSVNTFFYIIGGGNENFEGLGIEKLMEYAQRFGFGRASGIDLPHEAIGFLPSKAWKEETKGEPWFIGDTYNVSIGQGDFLVTPLQIARATAVFAHDGVLLVPHLFLNAPVQEERVISSDIADVVKNAMRQTVTNGSATMLNDLRYPVAGKTGTAQWANNRAPHSWFTGFGPYDDPEIVVTIIIEEGGDGYYAVPLAHDIFAWFFQNRMQENAE